MPMNLSQFLIQAKKPDSLVGYPVIYFKAGVTGFKDNQTYPLLFFSVLTSHLKKNNLMVQAIDFVDETDAAIYAKLQTSFLGQKIVYLLQNLQELDDKKLRSWLGYLQLYQGPNTLICYVHADWPIQLNNEHLEVMVSDVVDQKITMQLMTVFGSGVSANSTAVLARLFKDHEAIPLDIACLFMHYALLLGSSADYFVQHWLHKIVLPEKSLFTLSSHFFAKKSQPFFKLWSKIGDDYSQVFWASFWSEQLWRAHYYVELNNKKQMAEAKKIGMRLPFTFLQRDWQQCTQVELRQAHNYIYGLDYAYKNGQASFSLDLFYSKFFTKEFNI